MISGITLAAGHNATGYNFANMTPSTISGEVYYDFNHNGVLDSDDFGIAHVTITLEGTNDLGQSVEMTTVTNNEGDFSFGDLRPGTYELIRTQPAIFRSAQERSREPGRNGEQELDQRHRRSRDARPALITCSVSSSGRLATCIILPFTSATSSTISSEPTSSDPAAFAQHYPNLVAKPRRRSSPLGEGTLPEGSARHVLGADAGYKADQDLSRAREAQTLSLSSATTSASSGGYQAG